MSRKVLLVMADAAEAWAVRRWLSKARDDPFKVEWVSACEDAVKRLRNEGGKKSPPSSTCLSRTARALRPSILVRERLDSYSLSKALNNMLEGSAYAEALFLERERAARASRLSSGAGNWGYRSHHRSYGVARNSGRPIR